MLFKHVKRIGRPKLHQNRTFKEKKITVSTGRDTLTF